MSECRAVDANKPLCQTLLLDTLPIQHFDKRRNKHLVSLSLGFLPNKPRTASIVESQLRLKRACCQQWLPRQDRITI